MTMQSDHHEQSFIHTAGGQGDIAARGACGSDGYRVVLSLVIEVRTRLQRPPQLAASFFLEGAERCPLMAQSGHSDLRLQMSAFGGKAMRFSPPCSCHTAMLGYPC